MNAFIISPFCSASQQHVKSAANSSRRSFLKFAVAVATAACLPAPSIAEENGLPPGAAQFSNVLGAQKQWKSIGAVLDKGGLTDEDWGSLRGYLRTIYSLSGDMEFTAKPWEKQLKEKAKGIINKFRVTVKGMDKPAIAQDVEAFAAQHAQVSQLFDDFFAVFSEATVSDIPDEL